MSQRREIEARLSLYEELTGILSAMRSFALAELRRINKREAAQQQVVESLATALDDLTGTPLEQNNPATLTDNSSIWLLLGSERGFCGSFNEDVLRHWHSKSNRQGPLILVGERLHGMVETTQTVHRLPGAQGSLDAAATIDRILGAIDMLQVGDPFRLMACIRDEQGSRCQQLWPLTPVHHAGPDYPPLTFAPAKEVASGIAQHYLFHSLLALLLRSIHVENYMRLMQMETALRHLERGGEELQRLRNRLRQEEIVEEIELMAGSRHG